jgi:hypothetical protein
MINLYASRALRGGRSNTLMARTRDKGRVNRTGLRQPAVLCDGSQVLIRQIQPTDAPGLAEGFARLSARSRYLRFLYPKQEQQ